MNPMLDVVDYQTSVPSLSGLLDDYDDKEFFPLSTPGMAMPGPDFVEHAQHLGDTKPKLAGSREEKRVVAHGPILEKLYRAALYSPNFHMPIKVKGRTKVVRFVPGHLWGAGFPVTGPDLDVPVEVMVIGKCLGVEEDREGRNFRGKPSNQLVDILVSEGMDPSKLGRWYVTNLVKHLPVEQDGKVGKSLINNCRLLLEQEIRLVRPKYVLCLGSEASSWMIGEDVAGGVSASHGRVLTKRVRVNQDDEPEEFHEIQYMTCLHPAAVLHVPDKMPELRGTIRRFCDLVSGRTIGASEEVDHQVIWTEEHLIQTIDAMIDDWKKSGSPSMPIALDCEWHGHYWSSTDRPASGYYFRNKIYIPPEKGEKESWLRTIQFSHKNGFARTVVFRHGGHRHPRGEDRVGTEAFVPGIDAAVAQLKRLFTSTPERPVRIVGHNLRADLPWLYRLNKQLGETLIEQFDTPDDDPDPDGVTRLYGYQKCRHFGGFDTLYAMHAVQETSERKLEVVAMNVCGVKRYDGDVYTYRKKLCKHYKIKNKELPGYGEIPDEILHPYGNWDADATIRIYNAMVRPGGLLDKDQYDKDSWKPFWISQGKMCGELEMEMTGLLLDFRRAEHLAAIYKSAGIKLLTDLREFTRWPDFNPNSVIQTRCVLFGIQLAGKVDNTTGDPVDPRPPEAANCAMLNLVPVKASGKGGKAWADLVARRKQHEALPSCDKETLGILLAQSLAADDKEAANIIRSVRNFRFINKVLTSVICPGDGEVMYDEDGDMIFEKGFMASAEWDSRVRTHFLPVDTGRVSSSGPNIQNLSKRREPDLQKILESKYAYPQRSIVTCREGYLLVEADFTGAELKLMAIQAGSDKMVDHCDRSNLKDGDPRQFDIHSNVAVAAFNLLVTEDASKILGLPVGTKLPATKSALKACGKEIESYRDIAKTIAFGIPYGRGAAAVVRAVEELGIKITTDHVDKIRAQIFGNYPELEPFFPMCHRRVTEQGHMASCFGRRRRFQKGSDESLPDMERVAGNFPIQGGVADCTSIAIRNLYKYPGRKNPDGSLKYYMVAEIHDAVMAEVAIKDLKWYIEEVLPACMNKGVTIYACDLDGNRIPGKPGYNLGFDHGIYRYWGVKLSREEGLALGVDESLLPAAKK